MVVTDKCYNTHRERMFSECLPIIKRMAYSEIKKCKFIDSSEIDDYLQEILMTMWNNLNHYDINSRTSLTSFLFPNIKWAILKYYRKWGGNRSIIYAKDITSVCEMVDEEYNEHHIDSLNRAIKDLPTEKRQIVQAYLSGYSLNELDRIKNRKDGYHSTIMCSVYKLIRKCYKRYFEDVKISDRKLRVEPNGRINELNCHSKKIEMLSMDGNVVKIFPSLMQAAREGFAISLISRCIHGKKLSHRGYKWRLEGETNTSILNRNNRNIRAVKQIDLNGKLIRIYNSAAEAGRNGFDPKSISSVARGRTHSHRGYIWRYADEQRAEILDRKREDL